MDKKTKIICTMGPTCSDREVLKKMIENGMNVARLNFSHGTHESHGKIIKLLKELRQELNIPLPILLDTKGPEFRIGSFKNGPVYIKDGDNFSFFCEDREGDESGVSVSYKNLYRELSEGDSILVNDGLVVLKVKKIVGKEIVCSTVIGGRLNDQKSMSFPGKVFKMPYLSEKDKSDLLFGIENDIDFVACSFVSCAQDIKDIRAFLDENGGEDIQLIAKIENQSGVDNAEDILNHCEGLMVARGDLGVEVDYAELPAIQKKLIKLCNRKGGLCITATEMLQSMTENPRPTRAETSDVANAVFDGSSAIMLSGETAKGKYPAEAVAAMSSIAIKAENNIDYTKRFSAAKLEMDSLTDALSHAAAQLAVDTKATCIVSSTNSGFTARMISRCRVPMPVIAMTCKEKTYRQLDLYWNVKAMLVSEYKDLEDSIKNSTLELKSGGFASSGDTVVFTCGFANKHGGTKLIHADILK